MLRHIRPIGVLKKHNYEIYKYEILLYELANGLNIG